MRAHINRIMNKIGVMIGIMTIPINSIFMLEINIIMLILS